MPFLTSDDFTDILATLSADCEAMSGDDEACLRELIEEALALHFEPLPMSEFDSEFKKWAEIKTVRPKRGGRPKDTSMDTLVLALADIYARFAGVEVENLPVSASSRFAKFLNACARPLWREKDMTVALAGRWEDLRKVMRPQTGSPNQF